MREEVKWRGRRHIVIVSYECTLFDTLLSLLPYDAPSIAFFRSASVCLELKSVELSRRALRRVAGPREEARDERGAL
jgi:hypothetical protein